MNLVNIPLVLLVFSNLFLAFFVLINNRKSLLNKLFFSLIVAITLWILSNFLVDNTNRVSLANFWIGFSYFIGIIIPLLFTLFALTFSDKINTLKSIKILLISIPALFISIISFTTLIFKNVSISNSAVELEGGIALPLYFLVFIGYLIFSIAVFIQAYKNGDSLKKQQLKYFVAGTILTASLVIILNFIFPQIFSTYTFTTYTPYSTLIMLGSISYAIVRHRLLDIEVIIRRSLVYSTLLASLIGMYSGLVFVLNRFFLPGQGGALLQVTDVIAIVLVAFTIDPLKMLIEKATDKVFFKGRYNAEETIKDLSEKLVSEIDLTRLVKELKNVLTESIKVGKISIYLRSDHSFFPTAIINDFPSRLDGVVEKKHFITEYLEKHQDILIVDEIKQMQKEGKRVDATLAEAMKMFENIKVAVVVPLIVKGKLNGTIFLGEKLSQDIYSSSDIRFLEILSRQAALSLENAKLYEEQKLYGVRLTREVDRATGDLRSANEKLKELDKLKDEFMSIASHELRTPMTAIKSYVWLALHGKIQEKDPKVRDYLNKVFESSERMLTMINDMLNTSRIETGRLKMEIIPLSVWKVAEQVKEDLSARAAQSGVEIIIKQDTIAPLVMSDKDKLIEIYTNLIGNALKFTKKGGSVTISAQKKEDMVAVSITDTGVGISKENIGKLFRKYGKLNESYATVTSSTGTGLGLYITKQYLEKMKGTIDVESTFGKGTTFTFTLPIARGEDLKKHASSEIEQTGIFINPKLVRQFGKTENKSNGKTISPS